MTLSPVQALAQWAPAYKRGAKMQATLAALGGLAGIAAWWQGGGALWLTGAVTLLAAWPWTLLLIRPVNDRLLALARTGENGGAAPLLDMWARLHAVRAVLGLLASLSFALALS